MAVTEQDGVVQLSLGRRTDLLSIEDVGAPFSKAIGSRAALLAVDLTGAQAAVRAVLDSTGVSQAPPCYPTPDNACDGLRNGA